MICEEIRKELFLLRDSQYQQFQAKLFPTLPADTVIGVRTPQLRRYAKELSKRKDIAEFLEDLPHQYFAENQLHAFLISGIRDYDACMCKVRKFLPFVDNWATCDQLSPSVFGKHREELLREIRGWLASGQTYTVRFAIGMLMRYYLDEAFDPAYPEMVAAVRDEDYYVRMMIAWYFATALSKQYDAVLPYIENHRLDDWTHKKAIQKAVESYRIPGERKEYLKTLRKRTGPGYEDYGIDD